MWIFPATPEKIKQCEVPAFWGIDYRAGEGAPSNIKTDLDVENTDSKICQDVLTGLSAVAGEQYFPSRLYIVTLDVYKYL